MSKDQRTHTRAKVLSMTVRYKSATVDDFIEVHSHNVSRGGIFIKTKQPFPPGTLLKFEIRLADDAAVLAGVGRVVWKRDEAGDSPDDPAGMGVKFIKLDDKSALIARLMTTMKRGRGTIRAGACRRGSDCRAARPPSWDWARLERKPSLLPQNRRSRNAPEPEPDKSEAVEPPSDLPPMETARS